MSTDRPTSEEIDRMERVLWHKPLPRLASEDPIESLRDTINLAAKDWAACGADAWVFGVIVGWSGDALTELAATFKWNEAAVARLGRLHRAFDDLEKQ